MDEVKLPKSLTFKGPHGDFTQEVGEYMGKQDEILNRISQDQAVFGFELDLVGQFFVDLAQGVTAVFPGDKNPDMVLNY